MSDRSGDAGSDGGDPVQRSVRIETLDPTRVVGLRRSMSFAQGRMGLEEVGALWRAFRPRVPEITMRVGSGFISMRIYESAPVMAPASDARFDQWAAVAVSAFGELPEGMSRHTLSGGLYAVFVHRGPARTFGGTARFIYGEWLPGSDYELDRREHFEVLGPSYRPDDPQATEDIWIPIRPA